MKQTQKQLLLNKLYEGAVNSYTATFSYGIKQAPTRIRELREQGYNIVSVAKSDRSVDWVLKPKEKETSDKEMAEWIQRRMWEADRQERIEAGSVPQMEMF